MGTLPNTPLWPGPKGDIQVNAASDPAHEQQHDDNDQYQSQTAGRAVAPAAAVRPARQRADEQQNKYDQQNGSECHVILPWPLALCAARLFPYC